MASPRVSAAGLAGSTDASPIVLNGRFDIAPDVLAEAIGSPRAPAHAVRDRLADPFRRAGDNRNFSAEIEEFHDDCVSQDE